MGSVPTLDVCVSGEAPSRGRGCLPLHVVTHSMVVLVLSVGSGHHGDWGQKQKDQPNLTKGGARGGVGSTQNGVSVALWRHLGDIQGSVEGSACLRRSQTLTEPLG